MPGSGKSEAMHVATQRGALVVRMGDLIWEEVSARGLPLESREVGRIASLMREEHGPEVWALRTVDRVRAQDSNLVVIDGIRSNSEVEVFRRELGNDFQLIAIHTDPEHRFDRMLHRGREDDPDDVEVLKERDARELGWGIARTIALADEMVVNDQTLDVFHQRVEDLLKRLLD